MVPKKRFSEALESRKLAKGHSTTVSTATKRKPETSATFQGFHSRVLCQSKSSASAGMMIRIGNFAGTRWVTGLKTGPSFGCAGTNGKMRISAIVKIIYTAAVVVAAH